MLVDEIKKANVEAIKTKDTVARNIYSVLLNKIMLESIKKRETGAELVDADVIQIITKSLKELDDEKANYEKVNNTEEVNNINRQIALLKGYMPEMMSEKEIEKIISSLEDKSIGAVMKHFKTNYAGKCEMKTVQAVLNRIK